MAVSDLLNVVQRDTGFAFENDLTILDAPESAFVPHAGVGFIHLYLDKIGALDGVFPLGHSIALP